MNLEPLDMKPVLAALRSVIVKRESELTELRKMDAALALLGNHAANEKTAVNGREISRQGLNRIREAQKARWAKWRAAQKGKAK